MLAKFRASRTEDREMLIFKTLDRQVAEQLQELGYPYTIGSMNRNTTYCFTIEDVEQFEKDLPLSFSTGDFFVDSILSF